MQSADQDILRLVAKLGLQTESKTALSGIALLPAATVTSLMLDKRKVQQIQLCRPCSSTNADSSQLVHMLQQCPFSGNNACAVLTGNAELGWMHPCVIAVAESIGAAISICVAKAELPRGSNTHG